MFKVFKNKLIIGDKEIEFNCFIEKTIEFTKTIVVSYYPQTDDEFYNKNIHGGVSGVNKEKGEVKWSITENPLSMRKVYYNEKEVLNMRINDVVYIIDPDDGIEIYETPTKG